MPRRAPHVLFGLYCAVCAMAMTWPGASWAGGRAEPFVLGMPFSLVWYTAWALLTFVALTIYHRAIHGGRE